TEIYTLSLHDALPICRLLLVVVANFRFRDLIIWHKPVNDDIETACAGHGLPADADFLLDRSCCKSVDRCLLSDLDGDLRDAVVGSLLRFPLLYQRSRRPSHGA